MWRSGAAALLLSAALAGAAAAQVPDTAVVDTLLTDSLRRSPDQTQKLLDGETLARERVPVVPRLGAPAPGPALSRLVLDRDSIDWHNAETVGDLLEAQPGVYLWRSGWIGRPDYPNYQGRGAAAVQYILDGVPYVPLGPDSTSVDPTQFPLTLLDRVEIERWPGRLVVRLYTPQYDRLAPRSRIIVAAGDRKFARFAGGLERRYASGIGYTLAADYLNAPARSGIGTDVQNSSVLVQGSYVPSARAGLQYQLLRTSIDRRSWQLDIPGDTIGAPLKGDRSDVQVRGFIRQGGAGRAAQADVVLGSSRWTGSKVDQSLSFLRLGGTLTRPTWQVDGALSSWSRWTTFEGRVDGGWTPLPGVGVRGEAVHQGHDGGRQSDWVGLMAGATLPTRLALTATARFGSQVFSPSLATDRAQDVRDWRVAAGWQHRVLGLEGAWVHTGAFTPQAFQPYLSVPRLGPVAAADWLEVSARLSPRQWLLFEARYGDPQRTRPEGLPPTHSIVTATIRSKFLRQYRSGIFDLKLQLAMETWGHGVIGEDSLGTPITLKGATYFRAQVQFQLGSFMLYYDRMNLRGTELGYVPGFVIPTGGQTFGVRWQFVN
ncbi:MAG TPA: Plug domain-containing protein [Gemmatimonadales bacterium]|nr:Plug domain-containing protein [Gemmatimonadales bacterium]